MFSLIIVLICTIYVGLVLGAIMLGANLFSVDIPFKLAMKFPFMVIKKTYVEFKKSFRKGLKYLTLGGKYCLIIVELINNNILKERET